MKLPGLVLALCLGSVFLASCSSGSASLNAPSGLSVNRGANKVDLSWQDNSDNEAGFAVYRKLEADKDFVRIQQTAPDTESYTDRNVMTSGRYVYEVKAFASNGSESAPAAIAEAVEITILNTPSNLSATSGENKIDLSWSDNSDNEEGFRIFRKLESEAAFSGDPLVSVGADVTSYSDTSVSAGSSYVYQVIAFSGSSVSEASNSSNPASPTNSPNPPPTPVVESLEGEWRGQLEGVGEVELSADEDLDPDENVQRHNARFTYLNEDGTRFIFECRVTGSTFRCTEFDLGTGEDLGDNGNVITGEFVAEGKISGSFKSPFQQRAQALTLERVSH
jgi:hypothetical protein